MKFPKDMMTVIEIFDCNQPISVARLCARRIEVHNF